MIVLKSEDLKLALAELYSDEQNPAKLQKLMDVLKPVVEMTLERFPQYLKDDLRQELLAAIMKKAPYLAKAWKDGKIKTPTNYFMTFMKNNCTVALHRELKHSKRTVSIEDVKVDKVVEDSNSERLSRIFERVREEVREFIKERFPTKADSRRAEKYLELILKGERPTFKSRVVESFYGGRQVQAKEAFSVVLQQVRDRLRVHLK